MKGTNVGCPLKKDLESLTAASLGEGATRQMLEHLSGCSSCRKEVAFLTAVRLSLSQPPPGEDCLSDETLVLFRDNLLPAVERSQAISHLSRCDSCLRSWLSLNRALQEAAENRRETPGHLVEKAIALGIASPGETTWIERLFGPSPFFRIALAGSAAAVVFVLTVVYSTPPEIPPDSVKDTGPLVAEVPTPRSDTGPPPGPAIPGHTPEPGEPPGSQPAVRDRPTPAEEVAGMTTVETGTGWLQDLTAQERLRLLGEMNPPLPLRETDLVKALSAVEKSAVVEGYWLGKSLGTVEAFARYVGDTPKTRSLLAKMVQSAAALLKASRASGGRKLLEFANGLGEKMAAGQISPESAQRRLEVFLAAMKENLASRENARIGYELGRLSFRLYLLAQAQEAGYKPPRTVWPSREAIARVRRLLETTDALPAKERYSILNGLKAIGNMSRSPDAPNKAARILAELQQVERNIRAVR